MALIVSSIIFIGTYIAIISAKVHRSIAAMVGAVAMVMAGLYFGFYTQSEVISAIDWNTIGLLLGMMLIVGEVEVTGLFEALAVWIAKLSRGRYFYMILLFGLFTATVSTSVNNVTTLLLVAPISLSICSELGVDPKPILLAEALFSNVGGVATLIGDPPNVMIASAGGFTYMDFIKNLAPSVLISVIVCIIAFKFLFATKVKQENAKIKKKMEKKERPSERSPGEEVKDWGLIKKSLLVLGGVIVLFIFQPELGLMPATVALIGASFLLLITRPKMEDLVTRVSWTTLLFFAGLFVIVHGVSNTGLLTGIASGMMDLTQGNTMLATLAILFVSSFASAIIDNIPFTAAMIPVISTMTAQYGLESGILWWALAFGAGFGGNGTYIGSSPNVIAVKISEDYGEPISFGYWLKYGTIIMLLTAVIAALALVIQIITPFYIPLLPG